MIKTIEHHRASTFDDGVNEYLSIGWKLHSTSVVEHRGFLYYVAILSWGD